MSRHLLPSVRVAPFPCNSLLPSATTVRLGMLVLGVLLICRPAAAQTAADIIRVEEDWRVEIGVPDPDTDSPQIITVISPTATLEGFHAMFEMNHRTQPDFYAGGLQLQCWNGEVPLCAHSDPNGSQMSTPQEVVTFTTKMWLHDDGQLVVSIRNGVSATWGTFGNSWYLWTAEPATVSNLNGYSPETSTKHSRIGFASHQVQRLVLTQVRYYTSEGLHSTDDTHRVVHEYYATE